MTPDKAILKITATYCANYNGALLTADGCDDLECHTDSVISATASKCVERIVNTLFEDCDEDGEYQGDEDDIHSVITHAVKMHFGDIEVAINIDGFSS